MPESTIIDLGQKVKAKYPGQYDDLPDAEVGKRVKAKFPGQYDDFKDVSTAPDAASLAATKASLLKQQRDQMVPWYVGLFNRGNPSSPTSQALEKAGEQTAQVAPGAAEAVTGIPGTLATAASTLFDILKSGGNLFNPNAISAAQKVRGMISGATNPVTTPIKQAIEMVKPGLVDAPTPDAPETAAAARGAGTLLGGAVLAGGASELKPYIAPKVSNAFDAVKAKFKAPELDAAAVNKWMDVPSSEVIRGANPGQQLLDEKLLGPTKEATQANVKSALGQASKDIEGKLQAATQKGIAIDAQTPVYDAAAQAVKKIGRPRDAAFQANIDGIVDDIESRYPNLNKLSPTDAHKLKVELGDSIRWKGAAYDDPVNQVMVRIYKDLNAAIKNEIPGIEASQSRWGNLYVASKNLAESMADDIVGKGSGPAAPVPPPSPALKAAKTAAKVGIPALTGAGVGIKIYSDLTNKPY